MIRREQAADTDILCVMSVDKHSLYPRLVEFRVQLLSINPWNRWDRLNGKVPALYRNPYIAKAVLKVADIVRKQRSKQFSVGFVDPKRVFGSMDNRAARLAASRSGFASG